MSYSRVALAALGGTVAYFAFGFLVFGMLPLLRNEYGKYPAVYRTQEEMKNVMPNRRHRHRTDLPARVRFVTE